MRHVGKRGLRRMEMVGRMMDSIAEAPQWRRAKPSVSPAGDMGEPTGLSFVDTMIGLVQPPSPYETAKAAPTPTELAIGQKAPQSPSTKDDTALSDASGVAAILVPILPAATTPIKLVSSTDTNVSDPNGTGQLGMGVTDQASAAQSFASNLGLTAGLTGDTAGKNLAAAAGDIAGTETAATSPSFKSGEALATTTQTAEIVSMTGDDPATPAQALAIKTQAAASQSLLAGLSALGQTQQPVPEDSQVLQSIANTTTPAPAQAIQPSPQPTDAATAQAASTLDLAMASEPQGPSAARALEAQASQASGLKANSPTGWFANAPGLLATGDQSLQDAPAALTLATATPQANAVATIGLVPNLAKAGTKSEEAKIAATDTSGLMGGSNGAADAAASATTEGTSTPVQDTTPKPSLVQPHTIPVLAAAMMRRISNGMKEFTLRLDPPELGRVDVRLTVGPDKKVRAVVSTDRPEALKDLALSARDLTRALQEAGLDLEENGLSFSMNDQGSSQQNRDTNQQQSARLMGGADIYETSEAAKSEAQVPLSNPLSGPVERWQRARIALTA